MLKTSQHGFTLIELVVVIVILGILAAFAVPRFMGMEGEARAATVKSLAGALQSAATMARAKCQAQGCGTNGQVTIEGQTVQMQNGYPNRDSIASTLSPQSLHGFTTSTPNANTVRFRKDGGGANCWVQYTRAPNANTPPQVRFQSGIIGVTPEQTINQALANQC